MIIALDMTMKALPDPFALPSNQVIAYGPRPALAATMLVLGVILS